MPSPCAILGVPEDASPDQIRAAYRALARRYHPDVAGDAASAARFAEIARAYERALRRPIVPPRGVAPAPEPDPLDVDPAGVYDAFFGRGAPVGPRRPHPFTRREGSLDLELDCTISDREAACGGEVRIPVPSGTSARVAYAPGTRDGDERRLEGHGIRSAGGVRGDLYIRFRVIRGSGSAIDAV